MSTERIVVGVDFSSGSERAVEHALSVARRRGAELVLAHVGVIAEEPQDLPPSMKDTADTWRSLLGARLAEDRAALGELRARLTGQGVEVSQLFLDGFADTALAGAARELGASLIVVGTHGRTGFKRLLLGSVAEKTVRGADTSVLVARGEAPKGGYHRIVVGTDFSDQATKALAQAYQCAAPEADVRVVHGWNMPYASADLPGDFLAQLRDAAELSVSQYREEILRDPPPAGVRVRVEAMYGSPAAVLDDMSGAADLVVVGSHGRRGVRRFLLGSVAEATVRHARCTVLIAR